MKEKQQMWEGFCPKFCIKKTLCLFSNNSFRYSVLASLEPRSSTRKKLPKRKIPKKNWKITAKKKDKKIKHTKKILKKKKKNPNYCNFVTVCRLKLKTCFTIFQSVLFGQCLKNNWPKKCFVFFPNLPFLEDGFLWLEATCWKKWSSIILLNETNL